MVDAAWTTPERRTSGRDEGKALRKRIPRLSHADWVPADDRADPVTLLAAQNESRIPALVPIRHRRMRVSPFTFFRGAAAIMAADLATTPTTGLRVQACGDAHLLNFGVFASPERNLVFDVNDFDETLPGPWEWDVKRLAASFAVAARDREFHEREADRAVEAVARTYRETMRELAKKPTLDVWYLHASVEQIASAFPPRNLGAAKNIVHKWRSNDSTQALHKLAEKVDGRYRIATRPPLLVPLREVDRRMNPSDLEALVYESFASYQISLADHLKVVLRRFQPVDLALKVVGVGSVGTRCMVMLLESQDGRDPLFLQIKEATRSVLADHLEPSSYRNQGRRVVEGQRLMQAAGDLFLGWTESRWAGRQFYWRQLRDMKGSADLATFDPTRLENYATLCGWTLARAHARSGDPAAIAGYLGKGDVFDHALCEFASLYADQNERDYKEFCDAIERGRIVASTPEDRSYEPSEYYGQRVS